MDHPHKFTLASLLRNIEYNLTIFNILHYRQSDIEEEDRRENFSQVEFNISVNFQTTRTHFSHSTQEAPGTRLAVPDLIKEIVTTGDTEVSEVEVRDGEGGGGTDRRISMVRCRIDPFEECGKKEKRNENKFSSFVSAFCKKK